MLVDLVIRKPIQVCFPNTHWLVMRLAEIARQIDARIISADNIAADNDAPSSGTPADNADEMASGEMASGDLEIESALPIYEAGPNHLTMVDSVDRLADVNAAAVITPIAIKNYDRPQLVCSSPHEAFAAIVAMMRPPLDDAVLPHGVSEKATIDPSAQVHPAATVADDVVIGARTRVMPGAVIMGGSRIGQDSVIGPSVTLYPYTQVGDRCTFHAGCVLGARGFGYRREGDRHMPTGQLGYVVVEDDVEMGAAVTVDRGTYGTTRIGEGTKIDNHVMIAHNCQIGRRNLLCSQVGVAGSCKTGDDVILAGQVGLKDHITLGDRAIVAAQSGVMEDLAGDEVYLGSPCTSQRDQMQIWAVQRRLPEMRRELKRVTKSVAKLVADQESRSTEQTTTTGRSDRDGQSKAA